MNILKNSFYNFAGYLIPGILSIFILGYTARILNVEKFGLLMMIMAIVGYAGIFDMGISRAVIREVALYKDNKFELGRILSTSNIIVIFLGFIATLSIIFFKYEIQSYLSVSQAIVDDVLSALVVISFSIPIYLSTQVISALYEGRQEFLKVNIYKTYSGILITIIPFIFITFQPTLYFATLGLLVSRILSLIILLYFLRAEFGLLFKGFNLNNFKRLISFGGWVAVTNIISPILSYVDKLIISNNLGANMLGFYTAPSEIIARMNILPNGISRTIFPLLTESIDKKNEIKNKSYILMFVIILPVVIFGIFYSDQIIRIWFGDVYVENSKHILQILLIGFFFNALAQIPYTNIQAKGYSNITAIVHIVEAIPFLILLMYSIKNFGIIGVACVWSGRVIIDFIILELIDRFGFFLFKN